MTTDQERRNHYEVLCAAEQHKAVIMSAYYITNHTFSKGTVVWRHKRFELTKKGERQLAIFRQEYT